MCRRWHRKSILDWVDAYTVTFYSALAQEYVSIIFITEIPFLSLGYPDFRIDRDIKAKGIMANILDRTLYIQWRANPRRITQIWRMLTSFIKCLL